MRVWMRNQEPGGGLVECREGDPGAMAFDKASGKETEEGRAQRIAAALNSAMMLVPWKRVVSYGTRVELRNSAGNHYYDLGLDSVAEFHTKFNAAIALEPVVPTMGMKSRMAMSDYWNAAQDLGELLKVYAQEAAEKGDDAGSLLLIRLQLIQEELAELAEAMLEGSVVGCLDALTDITYVVDGTYLTTGLAHYKQAALLEVHRSNMSKLGENGQPVTSSAGRIVKGPNYSPPDLRTVLGYLACPPGFSVFEVKHGRLSDGEWAIPAGDGTEPLVDGWYVLRDGEADPEGDPFPSEGDAIRGAWEVAHD